MAQFNFPANPITGDLTTNPDSGTTYRYESAGFWKAIKLERVEADPNFFCLRKVGPPANDQEVLFDISLPTGFQVDLADFTATYSGTNPSDPQVFDILVNNVRGADNITVETDGSITVDDTRGPYVGAVDLSIQLNTATVIDANFGTILFASPVEAI